MRRVETKNQWARDDPAFVVVLACMMAVASLAYAIAFRVSSFWQYCRIVFSAIFFDFLLIGVVVATVAWCAAPHPLGLPACRRPHPTVLQVVRKQSAAGAADGAQCGAAGRVVVSAPPPRPSHPCRPLTGRWRGGRYAFDVHCNGYFPLFLIVYVTQFFLVPILLKPAFLSTFLANTLYGLACCYYWYITFLGYQVLPFLNKTTIFLYPCVAIGAAYIVSLVTRWNVSVFVLTMYFGHE